MRNHLLSGILGLILVFTNAVFAQEKSEQVLFNVTVTNKKGEWINGLKAENFKIYDEKKLQPITFFSTEDVPVSIGILVDRSESVGNSKLSVIQQGLTSFVNKSNPQNEYFLMTFNANQELLLDYTQGNDVILKTIEKLPATALQGNTKFYDALQTALEKISKAKNEKKVLLIISDAMDNESKNDFGDIKKSIKLSNVMIYSLNIMDGRDSATQTGSIAQAFSDEISKLSGGKSYFPESHKDAVKFLFQTAEELRNQYVIGFKAAEKTDKEQWHDVEIKVEVPKSSGNVGKVNVRTRKTYYLKAKGN
ncbi:MAG TPA: VWA domain-containing protein [Pyrinomonadaceae bacterium]|nr:VWA domain-containing protein [Pyrinomonadaceae bacterium]